VHDAGVVEEDVEAAPGVQRLDHGLDLALLGDVTFLDGISGRSSWSGRGLGSR
jgi:hypothetical protein